MQGSRRPASHYGWSDVRLCVSTHHHSAPSNVQIRPAKHDAALAQSVIRQGDCCTVKFEPRLCLLLYRGGLVSSAFRRSVDLMWGCHSQVLASLRDRHLGPPMMGSGGCGGPIYKGVLAVRLTAGIRTRNGLAPSIVLRGHRSAGRRNSRFSCFCCAYLAVRYISVTSGALTARALLFARSR